MGQAEEDDSDKRMAHLLEAISGPAKVSKWKGLFDEFFDEMAMERSVTGTSVDKIRNAFDRGSAAMMAVANDTGLDIIQEQINLLDALAQYYHRGPKTFQDTCRRLYNNAPGRTIRTGMEAMAAELDVRVLLPGRDTSSSASNSKERTR